MHAARGDQILRDSFVGLLIFALRRDLADKVLGCARDSFEIQRAGSPHRKTGAIEVGRMYVSQCQNIRRAPGCRQQKFDSLGRAATRHPTPAIAQLVEHLTVEWCTSDGPWFDSGSPDDLCSPCLLWARHCLSRTGLRCGGRHHQVVSASPGVPRHVSVL